MRRLSLLTLSLAMAAAAAAQDAPEAPMDLSIADNIATPAVPRKAQTYVTTAMDQLRRHLRKSGYAIEMLRDGQVIEITLPCSDLFAAGATELSRSGTELLRPLGAIAREPGKYKIIVAVHTDDTGDDMYADSISAARANAIDDYLWTLASEADTNVVPYGLGKDEPRVPNDTRNHRAANRRAEIYIVPDKQLLQMAGVKFK